MTRAPLTFFLLAAGLAAAYPCGAEAHHGRKSQGRQTAASAKPAAPQESDAEKRLLEIYKLIAQSNTREALAKAEGLVSEHPNFQLAQLVYGDLLSARARPVSALGDVPPEIARAASDTVAELREQALLRVRAFAQRPPAGMIPSQFVQLSAANKHAIAIDTSRARLYLFENSPAGPKLIADYYVSIGKFGVNKATEGDNRTPLGVYFVQTKLDPKSLKKFYGAGALPINYPNPFDLRRGKTGKGIWLHGTPPAQFARAPKATDGCIVLSNPDLRRVIASIEPQTTPVVIAPVIEWIAPANARSRALQFGNVFQAWNSARSAGDESKSQSFFSRDLAAQGRPPASPHGKRIVLGDLSFLEWPEQPGAMVVTFSETVEGAASTRIKRQYWQREGSQWKLFFDALIG